MSMNQLINSWEIGRLLTTVKKFEKLGLEIQMGNETLIKEECQRLMDNEPAGVTKASLEQLKNNLIIKEI